MTGAKCDLRNEQQREKREERRERREQRAESREGQTSEFWTTATQLTGFVRSRVGDPPHGIEASQDHDDKEKREERREERE